MPRLAAVGLAVLMIAAPPAMASQQNYNFGAAGTANSTTASCSAAIMWAICAAAATSTTSTTSVAAPLPALGSGLAGGAMVAASALAGFLVRRRHGRRPR